MVIPTETGGGMEREETLDELLRRGWSGYRIAKEVGVSRNTIYAWMAGWWNPGAENLKKLKALLGTEVVKSRAVRE